MAKPIVRRSFNNGEIAPTLWFREDVEKVRGASCRVLKNFVVHPHGAAERRRGFVRWADVSEKAKG